MSNKVKFMRWECDVVKSKYVVDDSLALELTHAQDGPIATATVYLSDFPIWSEHKHELCWIKTWSENEGILEALIEAGIVEKVSHPSVDVNGYGSKAIMVKVLI